MAVLLPVLVVPPAASAQTAQAFSAKVNFQSEAAPGALAGAGWYRDYGQPFGARTGEGQGTGLTYGWIRASDRQPTNLVGNGRYRTGLGDGRDVTLDSFMHMQGNTLNTDLTSGGTTQNPNPAPTAERDVEGAWQLAVPAPGRYRVRVAVGDPMLDGSEVDSPYHSIFAETAITLVQRYASVGVQGAATRHFTSEWRTVQVDDGALTITATNGDPAQAGHNTKLDWVEVQEVVAPPAPATVTATAGDGSVRLTWSAVDDEWLEGYQLYRATGTGDYAPLLNSLVTTTDHTDTTVANGTTYRYAVTAVNDEGLQSGTAAQSADVTPSSPDTTAPAPPTNLVATPGDGSAQLTWNPNTESDLAGYRVYRGSAIVRDLDSTAKLDSSYLATGLTNGTAVTFSVSAVDAAGNESSHSSVTVTPTATTADAEPAQPCSPYSVLACSEVPVNAPYAIDFASAEDRGVADADGQLTGFTMVQPASNAQAQGGYVPANLNLDAPSGQLGITTTNGIQYKTASDGSTTQRNNGLQNALGVGVDGTDDVVVRTALVQIPVATGATFEQAGLWLGPDEDTYAKLAVVSIGAGLHRVQFATEASGVTSVADEVNVAATDLAGKTVALELRVDQSTGQVTASYAVDAGAPQLVTETRSGVVRNSLAAPPGLLTKTLNPTIPGATTFAGIFATHRNRTSGVPLIYRFTDFAVADDGTGAGGPVEAPVDVKVNFQSAAATPVPAGYLRDFGQPFGARTGAGQGSGLTYGWVRPLSDTPLDLSVGGSTPGNGRDRGILPDAEQRWDTFLHAQADDIAGTFSGTPIEGAWQLAVPDGRYRVTVGVGDPAVNPNDVERHVAIAEDVVLVAGLVPTGVAGAETRRAVGSAVVEVTDQTLTLDSASGINSKFAWVEVVSTTDAPALRRPRITDLQVPIGYAEPPVTAPADGAVGVATTAFFSPTFANANGGIDAATLTDETVRLIKLSDGSRVPATVGTSGGTDVITLTPSEQLTADTQYRFEVTSGVRDLGSGSLPAQAFLPYSATFTTGAAPNTSGGEVDFDVVDLPTSNGAQYTSLTMGPDGKLYASTNAGTISRFPINSDGTLGTREDIDVVKSNNGGSRLVVGLTFDPAATASNLILWVTHTGFGISDVADQWGGKLSRLSGANLQNYEDYVSGLPRSKKDHVTNSIAFGPDGALYFNQGSNSAAGAPDTAWGFRAEELLSASVLRVDPAKILSGSRPLNVQTARTNSTYSGPLYDPYAAGAPVTLYATGIRNAFDLVWHSNGHLYVPSNGTAAGGNTPAGPGSSAACVRRGDGYTGAGVPGGTNFATQREFLFDVLPGDYYGHPNPLRCEFVMNGGNPAAGIDYADTSGKPGEGSTYYRYPEGTLPDPNYGGFAHDFLFNNSPNGVIEYQGTAFGGALRGRLIVARYSGPDDLQALTLSANGGTVVGTEVVYGAGNGDPNLNDPLDVVEGPGGVLYVTEYSERTPANARLKLLRPRGSAAATPNFEVSDTRIVLNDTIASGASAPQIVTLSNPGSAPLQVTGLTVGGTNGARFALVSPPALPLTLQPGESRDLSVTFTAAAAGPVEGATLTIASNDPTAANTVVELRGLGTLGLGGSNEPSLQWILDAHDIPVTVGDPNPSDSALPASPLLGQEVSAQRFVRVAERPVTVEPLAVFGPQDSAGTVTRVGWYPVGTPTTDNALFSVPNESYQSVAPSTPGTLSFDPGVAEFGLSSTWPFFGGRRVYSQDALNTWETVAANRHKVRAYPFRAPDGTVEPDAYVIAFEEHVSGYDYQDVVFVLRNVAPAGAPQQPTGLGRIDVANLDVVPFEDRLVFNRIQNPNTTKPNEVHDEATLRITNTGTEPLNVTGLRIDKPTEFTVLNAPALPARVQPGGNLDVVVQFVYSAAGSTSNRRSLRTGTLMIGSDDPTQSELAVELAGMWQWRSENGDEPHFDQVLQTFGYGSNVPGNLRSPGQPINTRGELTTQGDEVLSPYWRRANTSQPARVTQLAAFHTQGNTASVFWTPRGSNTTNLIMRHAGAWGQSFYPQVSATAPGVANFTPTSTVFGLKSDPEHSDRAFNNNTIDTDQGCIPLCGSHFRMFIARDRSGAVIPNTYVGTMDYAGINYDFQDNVYLFENLAPELVQVNPAAAAALPGATSLIRTFDAAVAGTLDGTGFSATQPNCHDPNVPPGTTAYENARAGIESTPVGLNTAQTSQMTRASCPLGTPRVSYQPGLLDVANGALAIRTFGTTATTNPTRPSAGTNGGLNNTLVNGLTQSFDASSGVWTASTRVLGPLGGPDGLTSGARQGGVMVGTDQDNFFKLAIIGRGSPATPSVEFFAERDRNSSTAAGNGTIGSTPALPNGGAVGFVDLHLTGDPSTGRISASYSVDGGAPVAMGTLQLTPAQVGRFFDRNVDAGLIAQSQNATPTTVRFDSFSVTRGLPAGGPAAAPREALHRLNVGTTAGTTGTYLGVPWTSDAGFFSPASAINEGANSDVISGVAAGDMPLYRTYRGNVGNVAQTSRALTYELPTRGLENVDLRLHLAERFHTATGKRVFDIDAEGASLRDNLDLFQVIGARNHAAVLEFNDVAVADGSLTLAFDPSVDYAAISAIEVLCDGTCPSGDTTAPAPPTGLGATPTSTGITLDWADSREGDLAGYRVERAPGASGPFTRITPTLLSTSTYADTTASVDATWHYRVIAVDDSGNASTPSLSASATRRSSTAVTYSQIAWDTRANAPVPDSEAQGEVVNGRLYVFGGFDSTKACCTPSPRSSVFEPALNTWRRLADMPPLQDGTVSGGVTHAGIATDGTDVFLASGYTSNTSTGSGQRFASDEVWRYNVAANTWTRLPDLPASNAAGQMEFANGRLHYFGGTTRTNTSTGVETGVHWVYDLARGTTGTWARAAALPNPRHHMASAVLGGRIYAIGGQDGHDGSLIVENDVHVYDPGTNTWTQAADLPSPRGHAHNSTVVDRGRIISLGGESAHGAAIAEVNAYDPATNTWTPNSGTGAMTDLPAARRSGVAAQIGGILYFTMGGSTTTFRGTPQGVISSAQ